MSCVARFTLTTRLVGEACRLNRMPFGAEQALHRRLRKLCQAGLLRSYRFDVTGENAYCLTKAGREFIGEESPSRSMNPVRVTMQAHEYELSRFWLKFLSDASALNLKPDMFLRDGLLKLRMEEQGLVPDGAVLMTIHRKPHLFFLEMDRSTETSGVAGTSKAVLRKKFQAYSDRPRLLKEIELRIGVTRPRVILIVVCRSEQRLANLRSVAGQVGFRSGVVFTAWPRLLVEGQAASRWQYRPANLFSSPLYSFPSRSPPGCLLS